MPPYWDFPNFNFQIFILKNDRLPALFSCSKDIQGENVPYQIFGYLAIWQGVPNIAKWGIPEKSIKNAAQKRWPQVRRTFHSKVMDENGFWNIFPLYILWARKKCRQTVIFQDKNLKIGIWALLIQWHLGLIRFLSLRKKCFFGSPYSTLHSNFWAYLIFVIFSPWALLFSTQKCVNCKNGFCDKTA